VFRTNPILPATASTFLCQAFKLDAPDSFDSNLLTDPGLTSVPGLHRDRGTLSAAGVALIGLGEPRIWANDGGWELRRAIGGGLLGRRPGGEIGFDCRDERGEVSISAILDGYAPRLPRPLYRLFQEPSTAAQCGARSSSSHAGRRDAPSRAAAA
jgi:hypothetical protein